MTTDTPLEFGAYRVIRKIGKGGFGAVYLAENTLFSGHPFAVKAFKIPEDGDDSLDLLLDELKNILDLPHSNIVQVRGFDVQIVDGRRRPYIVMDYIEGPNGTSYNLKQHFLSQGGRLSPPEVKRIFRQILAALSLVHAKKIAHLDLKPENILLDSNLNAYVSDFGISRPVSSRSLSVEERVRIMGFSPVYASPEQIQHASGSRHSDIFSLGVMMLEALTGHRPEVVHSKAHPKVDYKPPSEFGLDRKWDLILERCLSIDPAFRFPTANVLLKALQQVPTMERGAGAVSALATIPDTTQPTGVVSAAPSPTPTPRPVRTFESSGPDPLEPEARIARLLELSQRRNESASPNARSGALDLDLPGEAGDEMSVPVRVGGALGLGAGFVLGLIAGGWVGTDFGQAYAQPISRAIARLVGEDVGPWIGRDAGTVMGVLFGALLGAMGGLGLGVVLGYIADCLFLSLFRRVPGEVRE